MNAERLLAHYEHIADAPDAIERLRRFILDLAVRGKLVPQDATDEPASELLVRIAKEKARLLKAGEIKVRTSSARARDAELSFTLPIGWQMSELGEVSQKITDGAHKTPTYVDSGIPFVSVKDFSGGKLDLSNTRFIPEHEHEVLYKRCDPRRGDVLIGRIGTLGKAVLVDADIEFSLFVSVGLIRFDHRNIDPVFFRLLLNSPFVESEFNRIKIGGGTHTNKLNLGDLHTVAFPLPPLAEQHRIVAKVDELMGLCDRLEAARASREAVRDRLAAAGLARLNVPDPQTFQDDARFALDALPALTTRPDQIKQLRQTILNLAVRGKLVKQDPKDEPARQLHQRLSEEFKSSKQTGKRGRRSEAAGIIAEPPFEIPALWTWVKMGDLGDTNVGLTYSPADVGERGIPVLRSNNVQQGKIDLSQLVRVDTSPKPSVMVANGDMLICARNGSRSLVGKAAIIDDLKEPTAFGAFMAIFRSPLNPYLQLFLTSPVFRQVIDEVNTTTINQITQSNLSSTLVPLPPLAEQHRIVAKVDTLMAICDRLEASLTASEATRRRLLDALLAEALAPSAAHEMKAVE